MFLAVVATEGRHHIVQSDSLPAHQLATHLIFVTAFGIVTWKRIMHINLTSLNTSLDADRQILNITNLQVGH
jgi:hypothetical protein